MQTRTHTDVLISGMGPAALAVAYQAASLGKTVTLVSNRDDEFSRIQRVALKPSNLGFLVELMKKELAGKKEHKDYKDEPAETAKDIKFLEELYTNSTIAIKDLEAYLKRRLKFVSHAHGGSSIQYLFHSRLACLLPESATACVSTTKPRSPSSEFQNYSFQFLIGADGPSHHAADVVNRALPVEKQIRYDEKFISRKHAGRYFILKRKDGQPLKLPENNFLTAFHNSRISMLSYDLYSYQKKNQLKCAITCELPPTLASEKEIKDYLAKRAFEFFPGNGSDNLVIEATHASKKKGKDALKFANFDVVVEQATKAHLDLPGNKHFLLVGDAYHSAHYQLGHGLNDALHQADRLNSDFFNNFKTEEIDSKFNDLMRDGFDGPNYHLNQAKNYFWWFPPLRRFLQQFFKRMVEDGSIQGMKVDTESSLFSALEELNPVERLAVDRSIDEPTKNYIAKIRVILCHLEDKAGQLNERAQRRALELCARTRNYLSLFERNLQSTKNLNAAAEMEIFKQRTLKAIKKASYVLESQRNWNAFLKNFALFIATGSVYGIFWGRHYLKTGKHLFFNDTDTGKKVANLRGAILAEPVKVEEKSGCAF